MNSHPSSNVNMAQNSEWFKFDLNKKLSIETDKLTSNLSYTITNLHNKLKMNGIVNPNRHNNECHIWTYWTTFYCYLYDELLT